MSTISTSLTRSRQRDVLLDGEGPLRREHGLYEMHLDLGRVELLAAGGVGAGRRGAGAGEPGPLLLALHPAIHALTHT